MFNKKALLIAATMGAALSTSAQITYTSNNFLQAGDVIQISSILGTGYSITAPASTAQTWDFSTLQPILPPQDDTVQAASTGPSGSLFPTADIIRPFMNDLGGSAYIDVTSTEMNRVGGGFELFNLSFINSYTNPHTIQEAPITYGDNNNDSYELQFDEYIDSIPGMRAVINQVAGSIPVDSIEKIRIQLSGTETRDIDAFGTLRLADSTRNVIRQKSVTDQQISIEVYVWVNVFGVTVKRWQDVTTIILALSPVPIPVRDTTTRYDFLAEGYKQPLVTLYEDDSASAVDIIRFMPTQPDTTISTTALLMDNNTTAVLYPNPSSQDVVNLKLNTNETLSAELYSATGSLLRTYQYLQQGNNSISLNNLPSSNYVLVLKDSKGLVRNRQWLIKQ